MNISPPIPMDEFVRALTILTQLYSDVMVEEIDWELVVADMHAHNFPRAGTLYVLE